jgi:hypothetical protein
MNSVYGKTIEDKTKHNDSDIRNIETEYEKILKRKGNPMFQNSSFLNEDYEILFMKKKKCVMDKPVYLGSTILDLAKLTMYKMFYDNFKSLYGDKVSLIATDTDSLFLHIETEDFTQDLLNNPSLRSCFDFSKFPKDHPLYDKTNDSKLGKIKDELEGGEMIEFIGLRPKCYSYIAVPYGYKPEHGESFQIIDKKAKGVPRTIVKDQMTHGTYSKVLETGYTEMAKFEKFSTKNHEIMTKTFEKKALTCGDDKRFILPNGIDTLPLHYHRNNETYDSVFQALCSLMF